MFVWSTLSYDIGCHRIKTITKNIIKAITGCFVLNKYVCELNINENM